MATIGFLEWEDFLRELTENRPAGPIRVQACTKAKVSNSGAQWIEWQIFACAVTDNDILVARFPLGGAWDFDLKTNPEKEKELRERGKKAREILTKALEKEGFKVRPGLVAGCEEAKVTTSSSGLWYWEGDEIKACEV